ncbi:hypothetical protein DOZ91_02195 [Peribacillus frigoritolerans]|nr:hypothetical protein DOZ91_02195 [Peribacillus frigoritolerans]
MDWNVRNETPAGKAGQRETPQACAEAPGPPAERGAWSGNQHLKIVTIPEELKVCFDSVVSVTFSEPLLSTNYRLGLSRRFFVVVFYLSNDKSQIITNPEQGFKVINYLLCFK